MTFLRATEKVAGLGTRLASVHLKYLVYSCSCFRTDFREPRSKLQRNLFPCQLRHLPFQFPVNLVGHDQDNRLFQSFSAVLEEEINCNSNSGYVILCILFANVGVNLCEYCVYSETPLLWTPWGPGEVSCIKRCPYFRVNLY